MRSLAGEMQRRERRWGGLQRDASESLLIYRTIPYHTTYTYLATLNIVPKHLDAN